MNTVFLSLGGNLGNVSDHLDYAENQLSIKLGRLIRRSHRYKTAAWGVTNQPDFLNECLELETLYSPQDTLQICLDLEREIGRERKEKWGPRPIDIDILFYNHICIKDKNLIIPHPYLHERKFVLIPLNDIDPNWIHPVFNKSLSTLLKECDDTLKVVKC